MWKSQKYLKGHASKQTPEKALPWGISPSPYRHSKKAGNRLLIHKAVSKQKEIEYS